MLLTDRDCITFQDVYDIDPEVGEIAQTEHIAIEGDRSFIHQAVMEVGNIVLSLMQNLSFPWAQNGSYITSQGGGIWNWSDSTPPPRLRLNQIVVNSHNNLFDSPLKTWIKYVALKNFYSIAANRLTGDRYEKKQKQYESAIDRTYWPAVKASGIPVCWNAINCPGSLYESNQGIWSTSNISLQTALRSVGGTFDVAMSWVSSSLSAESGPSQTLTITVSAGESLSVNIASLNPPNTVSFNQQVNSTGLNVNSWNLYVGVQGGPLYLQSSTPIATQTVTLPSDPILSGQLVGTGQNQDTSLTIINAFFRC